MNDKIKFVLPAQEPAITVIIPYGGEEHQFNEISLCENDEAIIIEGGESIGHARIAGAESAKYSWLVFMDTDAIYPIDFLPLVKHQIEELGEQYPVLSAQRVGGYGNTFWRAPEHGLIMRKNVFLDRVAGYTNGQRKDIANLFQDAHKIPVEYHHDLTTLETLGSSAILIGTGLAGIAGVAIAEFKKRSYI